METLERLRRLKEDSYNLAASNSQSKKTKSILLDLGETVRRFEYRLSSQNYNNVLRYAGLDDDDQIQGVPPALRMS